MRLLPVLALAFGLGIFAADRDGLTRSTALVGLGASLAAAYGLRRRAWLGALFAGLAALAAGALALASQLEAAAAEQPTAPLEATVEAQVSSLRLGRERWRLELHAVRRVDSGSAVPRRVRVYGERSLPGLPAVEAVLPGDRLRLRLRLRAPGSRANPGGHDHARVLARQGIGAEARLVHPGLHVGILTAQGAPRWSLARSRTAAAARLQAAGQGGALLAALGLGLREGLSRAHRDALRRLGLGHLLAVSGLHLLLVAGGLFAIGRRILLRLPGSLDPRRMALTLALAGALLYAGLAGWGLPLRRALVFLAVLAAGFLARRPGPRLQPVALAALAVLAREPHALFDPGAQASFAASAALLGARRPETRRQPEPGATPDAQQAPLGRWGERLAEAVRTSTTALLATAPVAAVHFGTASALGLVANLVAIPWTTAVLLPAALLASAAALVAPDAGATGALLAVADVIAAKSLGAASSVAAQLPAPKVLAPPGFAALGLAILVVLVALSLRSLRARLVGLALALAVLHGMPPARIAPHPPRVVFLDVGQGDAVVVQGRQAAALIDGGPAYPGGSDRGRDTVLPALAALGLRHLDLVVATHADLDHRGGLPAVLRAVPVGELWLPPGGSSDSAFGELRDVARTRGVPVRERGQGDAALARGDLRATPLWPPRAAGDPRRDSRDTRNTRSLVVRFELAGRRLLLPGDLDAAAERALVASGARLRADVLLLPHHGSATSSSQLFLKRVGAGVAVASAPCHGRFAMPHPAVRQRSEAQGAALWWTGRHGAVLVGLAPRLVVRGWAARARGCARLRRGR